MIQLNKFLVIAIIFSLITANAFAQHKHKKHHSYTIIDTSCLCISDSLVKPDAPIDSTIAARSLKSDTAISADISNLLKNKNSKSYMSIAGSEILYYIKIDKAGNVTDAEYFLHYPHQSAFENLIIVYLKKLKFSPAYYIIENKNEYIKWEKMMHIKIS